MHDAAELRELPERPVALQHEAERARVRQVQERQRMMMSFICSCRNKK
jgi:hypothetical protein